MKNMKRFLALGMVACMVMGSMTACGSGNSDSEVQMQQQRTAVLPILQEMTEK